MDSNEYAIFLLATDSLHVHLVSIIIRDRDGIARMCRGFFPVIHINAVMNCADGDKQNQLGRKPFVPIYYHKMLT